MRTTTYKKLLPVATVSFCLALTGCSSEDEDLLAEPTPVTSSDETASEETTTEETSEETTTGEETTEETSETESEPEEDMTSVSSGTDCGTVQSESGQTLHVVAIEDGADCTKGIEIMRAYLSPSQSGELMGNGGYWTSPDGWMCTGYFVMPGEADIPENRRQACGNSAQDRQFAAFTVDEL